jgi:alpha-glucosidase
VNFTKDKDAAGWRFEGNTLTTVINVPASPVSSGVQIVVGRAAELRARQAELDDFAGVMTRLREAYDTLNQNWPLGWSPDELVDAMQTGDRLSYHPENAGEQLARLGNLLPKVIASVADLSNQSSEKQRQVVIRKLSKEYKSNEVKGVAARFQNNLARAKATLADTGGKP